jgi:hypothetical protein
MCPALFSKSVRPFWMKSTCVGGEAVLCSKLAIAVIEPLNSFVKCVTMAATNDHTVPATVLTALYPYPYPPSPVEARCFYYGIPSQPRLVARSSTNVWVEPTGPEAYLIPKESRPVGLHPLREIWEATVGLAMVKYLDSKGVKWTSLDPIRMGYAGESSPPAIVWVGVVPGSLFAEDGVEVATHCKSLQEYPFCS